MRLSALGLYQLVEAVSSRYPDSIRTYDYSKNGNRISLVVDTGTAQQTIIYNYTDNRLTEIIDTDTTFLFYDATGNMTKMKTGSDSTTYEYNDAGQLTSIDNGATARYLYDGRGRRIKAVVGNSGRYIFYDQAGRIISEFITDHNKWDQDFIYLNGRIIARVEEPYESNPPFSGEGFELEGPGPPQPNPLPMVDIFYYHTDHLGTPVVMSNNIGNICWKARYYPFGELSYEWVSAGNYIRFPGQWHDEESDLYYNWHRYYDPTIGRYLQSDPLATPAVSNPYGYARNNPLRFIDPTGLWEAVWNPYNNTVTAISEEGDVLSGLYTQMGLTAAEFEQEFGVSEVGPFGIGTRIYQAGDIAIPITEHVIKNPNISSSFTGSNCHGFVSYASGIGATETELSHLDLQGKVPTNNPVTGDWAVFGMLGQYWYEGEKWPEDAYGKQGHSAIYILRNQANKALYLNRINTGEPVTVSSQSQIEDYFANPINVQGKIPYKLKKFPELNPNPKFYR